MTEQSTPLTKRSYSHSSSIFSSAVLALRKVQMCNQYATNKSKQHQNNNHIKLKTTTYFWYFFNALGIFSSGWESSCSITKAILVCVINIFSHRMLHFKTCVVSLRSTMPGSCLSPGHPPRFWHALDTPFNSVTFATDGLGTCCNLPTNTKKIKHVTTTLKKKK